ncbi:hypothetical protein Tco_1474344 [Tanacetum coccineum]
MATMVENVIAAGSENHPPMLEKGMYDSWKTRILLYIRGKENGEMLIDSIENGTYQLLPEITPGESIHSYYQRYAKLINDMKMIPMSMSNMKINTKFVNHLQPEWIRLVTAAKQARDLHRVNFDQLTQATIQNGQFTVQNVQGRQSQGYAGSAGKNQASGARVVNTVGYTGENQPMDKMLLAQAQEAGVVLNDEQQDFLADSLEETDDYEDLQLQATISSRQTTLMHMIQTVMTKLQQMQSSWQISIMGYGDLQMGNILISRVYYVEGLGHNLFFVGKFCDSDLEVAFKKHTCFVCNLEGVDLLLGSRGSNLYTISMADMMKSFLIGLARASLKDKIFADYYFKEDYTIVPKPRVVVYKFNDGTLTRVMEKLDHMVKDFHLFEYNKGMETRKWSEDDKRRSKDFITAIEKRLQIRRIFRSLESFVGGRIRDIDYRLINRTT